MQFKSQLKRDIKSVFHNKNEFAEIAKVRYGRKNYKIPVILDYEGAKNRVIPLGDHADGIFAVSVRAYIPYDNLKVVPRKSENIEIGDDIFKIVNVSVEAGEIILELEMLDE